MDERNTKQTDPGIPEVIEDGNSGLLCKPCDECDLAAKIAFFLEHENRVMIEKGGRLLNIEKLVLASKYAFKFKIAYEVERLLERIGHGNKKETYIEDR